MADPARVRDPNRKGTVEHAIRPHPGHGLEGPALPRVHRGPERAFLGTGREELGGPAHPRHRAAARCRPCSRRSAPPQTAAADRHAVFQRGGAHRLRRQLRAGRPHSSYARPAAIGSKVLVRIYAQRIEIRDILRALLRTHARAERPGTVVLPMAERVFNPSRETV